MSVSDIHAYVNDKEEKEVEKEQCDKIKSKYASRLLGQLTIPQPKQNLCGFNVTITREQNNKPNLLQLVDNELAKRKLTDEDIISVDE